LDFKWKIPSDMRLLKFLLTTFSEFSIVFSSIAESSVGVEITKQTGKAEYE